MCRRGETAGQGKLSRNMQKTKVIGGHFETFLVVNLIYGN